MGSSLRWLTSTTDLSPSFPGEKCRFVRTNRTVTVSDRCRLCRLELSVPFGDELLDYQIRNGLDEAMADGGKRGGENLRWSSLSVRESSQGALHNTLLFSIPDDWNPPLPYQDAVYPVQLLLFGALAGKGENIIGWNFDGSVLRIAALKQSNPHALFEEECTDESLRERISIFCSNIFPDTPHTEIELSDQEILSSRSLENVETFPSLLSLNLLSREEKEQAFRFRERWRTALWGIAALLVFGAVKLIAPFWTESQQIQLSQVTKEYREFADKTAEIRSAAEELKQRQETLLRYTIALRETPAWDLRLREFFSLIPEGVHLSNLRLFSEAGGILSASLEADDWEKAALFEEQISTLSFPEKITIGAKREEGKIGKVLFDCQLTWRKSP